MKCGLSCSLWPVCGLSREIKHGWDRLIVVLNWLLMRIFHLVLRLSLSVVLVPLIVAEVTELVTTCVVWKVRVVVTLVTCDRIIVLLLVSLFLWIGCLTWVTILVLRGRVLVVEVLMELCRL